MRTHAFADRARQAWTIAKIELRRVFFAKRSFWVYGLALLPSAIFFGHGLDAKISSERMARRGVIAPALIDSIQERNAGQIAAGAYVNARAMRGRQLT